MSRINRIIGSDDAQFVSEMHTLNNPTSLKKFSINFQRSHLRKPESKLNINSVSDVIRIQS